MENASTEQLKVLLDVAQRLTGCTQEEGGIQPDQGELPDPSQLADLMELAQQNLQLQAKVGEMRSTFLGMTKELKNKMSMNRELNNGNMEVGVDISAVENNISDSENFAKQVDFLSQVFEESLGNARGLPATEACLGALTSKLEGCMSSLGDIPGVTHNVTSKNTAPEPVPLMSSSDGSDANVHHAPLRGTLPASWSSTASSTQDAQWQPMSPTYHTQDAQWRHISPTRHTQDSWSTTSPWAPESEASSGMEDSRASGARTYARTPYKAPNAPPGVFIAPRTKAQSIPPGIFSGCPASTRQIPAMPKHRQDQGGSPILQMVMQQQEEAARAAMQKHHTNDSSMDQDEQTSVRTVDTRRNLRPLSPEVTSLCVRNVPARYSQKQLLKEWKPDGSFDFLYLLFSVREKKTLGCAFINFRSHEEALIFQDRWHGRFLESHGKNRALDVTAASVQGYEANLQHLRQRNVEYIQNDECLPALFCGLSRLNTRYELGKLASQAFTYGGVDEFTD
mmetsp:Transcript_456/g.1147  ORF Transcript_456/g.1147 Transcript_456/m.1147 type:complete len:508 (-) Transcript_456:220-1743(-)